jgi:hypothetical protein
MLFSPAVGAADLVWPATARIGRWWSTSCLLLPAAASGGTWELTCRQSLDGTSASVHLLPVARHGKEAGLRAPGEEELQALAQFLRPAHGGFLVGVKDLDSNLHFYFHDAAPARRSMRSASSGTGMSIPAAYLLDDLTYGLLWALTQLDDGLLADDQALDAGHRLLSTYLVLPRSAPGRLFVDLTSVGTSWVGAAFCPQHIQQQLSDASELLAFWTREQQDHLASRIHVAAGLKGDSADGRVSHLLGATVQFICEIPIVEALGNDGGPALTRRLAAELYDVPLLRFGTAG